MAPQKPLRPTAPSARPSSTRSKARETTILAWAQRLMQTKGYGWSKAVDKARDMYGEGQ